MPITVELTSGKRILVERDSATIGRGPAADIVVKSMDLQPIHAKISRVAGRWMIESAGDWLLQVGDNVPGRKQWLEPDQVVCLTESGIQVVFQPTMQRKPASQPSKADVAPTSTAKEKAAPSPNASAPSPFPSQPKPPAPSSDLRRIGGPSTGSSQIPKKGIMKDLWDNSEDLLTYGMVVGGATGFLAYLILGGFLEMVALGAFIGILASCAFYCFGLIGRSVTLGGGAVIAGIVAATLFGISYTDMDGNGGWAMSESQMRAFVDNPSHFKGKTLTMNLFFKGQPLSAWVEKGVIPLPLDVQFDYPRSFHLDIHATIPAGMKVPSLSDLDTVRVTFICKEGSQDSGNIITQLSRR